MGSYGGYGGYGDYFRSDSVVSGNLVYTVNKESKVKAELIIQTNLELDSNSPDYKKDEFDALIKESLDCLSESEGIESIVIKN